MQEEEKEKEDGCSCTANNKAAGGREGGKKGERESVFDVHARDSCE